MLIVELNLDQILDIELKQVQNSSANPMSAMSRNRQTFTRLFINAYTDNTLSRKECVQLEFEYGGHNEFSQLLKEQLDLRKLMSTEKNPTKPSTSSFGQSMGITGIQRNIQSLPHILFKLYFILSFIFKIKIN
jgi:hypothetical protein